MDIFGIQTLLIVCLALYVKFADAGCAYPDILHTYPVNSVRFEDCDYGSYSYPLICQYDGTWEKYTYICNGDENADKIARRVALFRLLLQRQEYFVQRDSRNLLNRIIQTSGGLPPPHPPMSAEDQLHVLLHNIYGHHGYFPPGYPTTNTDDNPNYVHPPSPYAGYTGGAHLGIPVPVGLPAGDATLSNTYPPHSHDEVKPPKKPATHVQTHNTHTHGYDHSHDNQHSTSNVHTHTGTTSQHHDPSGYQHTGPVYIHPAK